MSAPSNDLQSKITRAIRAYLISVGAASTKDAFAAPCSEPRELPNTTIVCGDGNPWDGPGNFQFPHVLLILRDDAVAQAAEPNSLQPRITANQRCSLIVNALSQSDDDHTLEYTARQITAAGRALAVDSSGGTDEDAAKSALDNEDMTDFTILWWESGIMGSGAKSEDGNFWERTLQFSCVACSKAID